MIGRRGPRVGVATPPAAAHGTAAAGSNGAARSVAVKLSVACDDDVDGERWSRLLAATLVAEGVVPGVEVGLSFVTPATMAELNAAHMGTTGPTDVLAFPIDGRDAAGGASGSGPPGVVGDVVVCPSVAHANAPGHAGLAADELALLVVHGALHLIGHDHAEGGEREQMQARERALLAELHGPLAADPWAER
jgi:probable rRNA maturation factor